MGLQGAPFDFFAWVRSELGISIFVEGGTLRGDTAARAAQIFGQVYTIELSPDLHEAAQRRHAEVRNVTFLRGSTRDVLRRLVPELQAPAIFWLDAHWSGSVTAGREDECPILEEIAIINESSYDHILVIDDARLFLAAPPPPHDPAQWPDIWQLREALTRGAQARTVAIIPDFIVAAPPRHAGPVVGYWRLHYPEEPSPLQQIGAGLRRLVARR